MNQFYLILLTLFLFSCSQDKKQQEQIVLKGEITFEGVKGYAEYYFFDTLQNKEYLSFFTIRSKEDSLKVFEFPSAKLLYSVPMYDLWDTLNGIQMRTFSMIGVDTFCISAENNVFVFLNKFGEVYKWLDMTPYSEWRNLKLYYNYDFSHPVQSSTKNLYFKIGAEPHDTIGSKLPNKIDRMIEKEFARETSSNYCRVRMEGDSIVDIEYFVPFIRSSLFGKGYYLSLGVNEPQVPVNDKYYFASCHRDTVYEINRAENKIVNKYKITSKYTKLGYMPCIIKETGMNGSAIQNCGDEKIIMDGYLNHIHYFPSVNKFFLLARHTLAKGQVEAPRVKDKSASLIILNDKFETLDEILFDHSKVYIDPQYTKDGFLLKKRGDIKSKIKDENYTYQYYTVN